VAELAPRRPSPRDLLLRFVTRELGAVTVDEAMADPEIRTLVDALLAEPLGGEPPPEMLAAWGTPTVADAGA